MNPSLRRPHDSQNAVFEAKRPNTCNFKSNTCNFITDAERLFTAALASYRRPRPKVRRRRGRFNEESQTGTKRFISFRSREKRHRHDLRRYRRGGHWRWLLELVRVADEAQPWVNPRYVLHRICVGDLASSVVLLPYLATRLCPIWLSINANALVASNERIIPTRSFITSSTCCFPISTNNSAVGSSQLSRGYSDGAECPRYR